MGTDIHSVAQIRVNGKWTTVLQDVGGDNRNYNTFAALADVRNGTGFAGCDTGDRITPISEPRGLPDDFKVGKEHEHPIRKGTSTSKHSLSWADAKYRGERLREIKAATSVWMGDHSHSWITLDELHKYTLKNQKREHIRRGYVTEKEYLKYRQPSGIGDTQPDSWCGFISGHDVVTMLQDEYDVLEAAGKLPRDKEIYVQYQWSTNMLDTTDLADIQEDLEYIAERNHVSTKDVRMVFGFDS